MTNKYRILLTRKAHEDIRDIYRYIKEELQKKSSALYTVDEQQNEVHIIRIIYGKRDYQDLI